MGKIRLVTIALAAVLLVALALLIRKAFASAASERSARHRAVAERILDEMERELTALLRREENRPFEHYRYSYLPETARQGDAMAPRLSPLSAFPPEPFLYGYFQILPDGTLSSPHRPGPLDLVPPTSPYEAEGLDEWIDRLEEAVGLLWRLQVDEEAKDQEKAEKETQQAGTTVEVSARAIPKKKVPRYLETLNRGARSRTRRPSKLEQTQLMNIVGFEDDARESGEDPELLRSTAAEILDVRLEPMVGRSAGEGLMVLYRTVSIDERAYRQGLLIDIGLLVGWLAERILTDAELAARAIFTTEDAFTSAARAYTYRHRFAEPFGSVHGVLALDELPEAAGTTTYLTLLSLLLVLTATLGLFGLYRMVAVVVEFAERRHNFVSAVTHELKTPLTAIRMYGEMLRDGVIPDESRRQQYYETITSETERLTRLLQNVLELARLEKDTRTMHLTIGDITPVIDEVIALVETHARKEGFEICREVEAGLPPIRFDRDALLQVLFNLVDNALKYARKAEEKRIVLRCRRQGDGVALSVLDYGPGVAREHLGKIFEPFYRGENELTRKSKGTGIGLALVRGLVEQMGGHVMGRNAGGGGFEVVVSLNAA